MRPACPQAKPRKPPGRFPNHTCLRAYRETRPASTRDLPVPLETGKYSWCGQYPLHYFARVVRQPVKSDTNAVTRIAVDPIGLNDHVLAAQGNSQSQSF